MTTFAWAQTLALGIRPLDAAAMSAARARQATLTKPPGSLGLLEAISVRVAGIRADARPTLRDATILVAAGDHGVAREGVSAYPPEVTAQMMLNFARGGAAINAIARQVEARVLVVDFGVAAELPPSEAILSRKVARGTQSFLDGPAMTRAEVEAAARAGAGIIAAEHERGLTLLAVGEMGIGNTTAASALTAALTGADADGVTGRGTGVSDGVRARKAAVVRQAVERHTADAPEAAEILARLGGLEIAGMVGAILGAAGARIPIILDGFISSTAALVAARIAPAVRDYLFASHLSEEPGHRIVLEALGLEPVLHLRMRLGEGTGAALLIPTMRSAVATLTEMATFEEAGVSGETR